MITPMTSANYISTAKYKELGGELAELKGPKRKQVLESLAFAKSLGDLSENAEYHNARDEQARLEDRIIKIEEILKSSQIVDHHKGAVVEVGSTVIVQKKGDKTKKTYIIVGSEESDMVQGKISNNSPLGEALMGKKKGDVAPFITPKGAIEYSIVSVE